MIAYLVNLIDDNLDLVKAIVIANSFAKVETKIKEKYKDAEILTIERIEADLIN